MKFHHGVSIAAIVTGMVGTSAVQAQTANTTPANVNVLNLLSPYLALNATPTGQQTLQDNLNQAVATNNQATLAQQQLAISDKALPGSPPFLGSIKLIDGTIVNLGPGDNLAGGLPLQAAQSPGGLNPYQPVGGYGVVLGSIYQTGIRSSTASTGPLAATYDLLTRGYNFTSSDLGVAKNYFANGAATNPSVTPPGYVPVPAVAPPGYTLPTFNGLPNTQDSVYDIAYGVKNTDPGQDVYGSSRPVQVAPDRINPFDPTALNGLATNPSFPSGHTTYAYTDGILLAMLVPEQYQSMIARAAEYANSRIVLGVHYPLDIIASRALVQYDLAQAFTNPLYVDNAATTGTAIDLPSLFVRAQGELNGYLSARCGDTVANCSASQANTANNPYVPSSANQALFQSRLTYGLPTLTFAQAPREAAPVGGPDASILLAPLYGGSTDAAKRIEPNGGIYGNLQTSTINQIIVNTETNALAAFYGSALSYWTRIDLYSAAGYFGNVTGTLVMDARDRLTIDAVVGDTGALYDNGTITGQAFVLSGGLFGGIGAVGGLTAFDGSIVSPGSGPGASIGTLTVAGNAAFAPGSTYRVETTASGQSDRLAVGGTATLFGGTVDVAEQNGGYAPRTRYTILTADGGVSGRFDGATSEAANLTPTLRYRGEAVDLTLTRTDIPFSVIAQNRNQAAVADAVQGAGPGSGVYDATIGLSTPEAQGAFQALSGDIHASASTAEFGTAFFVREAILDRLRRGGTPGYGDGADYGVLPATYTADLPGRQAPVAMVPARIIDRQVLGLWGQGFGAFGEARGDGNAAGLTRQTSGFVLGADLNLENGIRVGVAGGYSLTNLDTAGRQQSGEIESGFGAIYGGKEFGPLAVRLGAVYADNSLRTRRTVIFPGVSEVETARYGGSTVQGFGELGYRFALGNAAAPALIGKDARPLPAAPLSYIEPFVGGAYVSLDHDRFQEAGGIGALRGLGRTNDVGTVTAGVRAQTVFDLGLGAPVTAYGLLGYRRAFGDVVPTALLAFSTGPSFVTAGIPIDRDALVANAGLDLRVASNATIGVAYTGQVGERAQDHAVKGNFTYRW